MERIIYILLISFLLFSCSDDDSYPKGTYFSLTETSLNFDSDEGQQSIELINVKGEAKAKVITEDADWCTVSVSNNNLIVKVVGNPLFERRTAVVEVTSSDEKVNLMVSQARKEFSDIPKVKNLEAIPGPGEVTLKWNIPEQDNFSHVMITYEKGGKEYEIIVNKGITEHTIIDLLNRDGEVDFNVTSIDGDWKYGPSVQISSIPEKAIGIRFENDNGRYLPYYFATDNSAITLTVGRPEYDENEETILNFDIDEKLLAKYNKENNKNLAIIPQDRVTLPQDFLYTGTESFQDLSIPINSIGLIDQSRFALPIKITSSSKGLISKVMFEVVIEIRIDDLEGWYTVDRLEKCGEGASKYPSDPAKRRRYIKRTGVTTWETGYLFNAYVNNENHTSSGSNVQYITLDPETKKIHIQQNGHATNDDRNVYDPSISELHIEYLYSAWAGWWTHERMYNRSMAK